MNATHPGAGFTLEDEQRVISIFDPAALRERGTTTMALELTYPGQSIDPRAVHLKLDLRQLPRDIAEKVDFDVRLEDLERIRDLLDGAIDRGRKLGWPFSATRPPTEPTVDARGGQTGD